MDADDLRVLHTYVDASYAIHPDMRSHTGGDMSFGRGVVHTKSSKQKLNTKSSTKFKVVGISDYIPYNIWLSKRNTTSPTDVSSATESSKKNRLSFLSPEVNNV